MRILYVGELHPGSTCRHRLSALIDLGHQVTPLDTCPPPVSSPARRFFHRVRRRLLAPPDLAAVNPRLLAAARQAPFDLLWVDKGTTITPATLRRFHQLHPAALRVHYNPDDPFGAHAGPPWRTFVAAIPHYDAHLVPRPENVPEYLAHGAPRVFQPVPFWGFDPALHAPRTLPDSDRSRLGGPVGFIGTCEDARARSIAHLVAAGIPVKVWGDHWDAWNHAHHAGIAVAGPTQYGPAYADILCSFDINLAFLRLANRDRHTSRSVEIPACAAFMLAQRSDEHLALFHEGSEADFFSCDEELLAKVKYYLEHPGQRQAIAAAGRRRCLSSGYSNQDRLRAILAQLLQPTHSDHAP